MEQVLTDGSACKAKIIESISKAKSTIKVAMAFFTDKEIADQLIAAKHKGVDVNVILSNADINNDIIDRIKDEVSLIIFELNGSGIMHHKFCIIDNSLLLQGTYNYTYNATKNNKESLNITDSSNQIASYSEIFEELTNDANMMNPNLQEEPSS